jgi:two-component system KDP operon response regulator KdpE
VVTPLLVNTTKAMPSATILIVDDDPQIRRALRISLTGHGYEVTEAKNGEEALRSLTLERPDVILLDVNLPGMTGIEVCRSLRGSFEGPIIIVSVRNTENDKIAALDSGADDYIVKPFPIGELLARIRATRRRSGPEKRLQKVELPGLLIDFEKRIAERDGKRVRLTPRELDVLHFLAMHHGKPVTHEKLLHTVWGPNHAGGTDNLRVVIKQLRKKIEQDPAHPRYLLTEPWTGYRFEVPETSEGTSRRKTP